MSENTGVLEREIKPGSMEDFALGRVIDLKKHEDDFVTHTTRLKRLNKVLTKGAYSSDFAERIKDDEYEREFGASHNLRNVSIITGELPPWRGGEISILISSMRARSDFETNMPGGPARGEKVIPIRSAPRWFLGLGLDQPSDLERILAIARQVWDEKPEGALPIYNIHDKSLIWPKQMTHKQITTMLSELDRKMIK